MMELFDIEVQDELEHVRNYFARLSTSICTDMDKVGYDFCRGNIMAMNPKWCQPLSTWKKYFSSWVAEADPQDLMEVGIFFDFNCRYGEWRYFLLTPINGKKSRAYAPARMKGISTMAVYLTT